MRHRLFRCGGSRRHDRRPSIPFDATGFPPGPPRPERPPPSDNVVTVLILVVCFLLLVTPVSLAALVDIVHYLQNGR